MKVYRIGWREALKIYFVPIDIVFILVAIGIPVLLSIILIFQIGFEAIIPITILLIIMLWATLSNIGDGWKLDNNNLEIKIGSISRVIAIDSMDVGLVESTSDWLPILRTNGFSAPGLSTGCFKLRNGINAIVFRHTYNGKALVLLSNNQYYIISHSGIENFYNRIVQFGAKTKVF